MIDLLKRLQFKRDPRLILFAVVLVFVVAFLISQGHVTVKEGFAFLGGALALPGLFGAKTPEEDGDS